MKTTDKVSCQILFDVIKAHGVKNVVISPGSRNAPLIIQVARDSDFKKTIIVDERSAAFIALGMCAANFGKDPVVLICTSGTALLNYSPAIAEAYYRNLPLIVISADRPIEWIDQDDSQTLRQFEALSNYVKRSYDIPSHCDYPNMNWYINRIANDALICATTGRKGPVHINVQLDEPLNALAQAPSNVQRIINSAKLNIQVEQQFFVENIFSRLFDKKILIVAGFQNCEDSIWSALKEQLGTFLSNHHNAFLLSESISNISYTNGCSCNIDRVLSFMNEKDKATMKPDIVITMGGALVSRFIKQYIRESSSIEHWHIGITTNTIDCFQSLTTKIDIHPNIFFQQLNSIMPGKKDIKANDSYQKCWEIFANRAKDSHDKFIQNSDWSDLKAFSIILPHLYGDLHLSNGTPIRYQQLFDQNNNVTHVYCNRGVSGIDGCTSTAMGHAMISKSPTTLITGDLSAQYDLNALCISQVPSNFKMIIMCNGGGGIFRFIKSTSELPEVDEYFATKNNLPIKDLATGYGYNLFIAQNEDELINILPAFLHSTENRSILAIYTPAHENANILKNYFNRTKNL